MKPYYEDDLVTLFHGDCLEISEWLTADVLVTDPPYGIAYRQQRQVSGTKHDRKRKQDELRAADTLLISSDKSTRARDSALELFGMDRPALVFGSWRMPRPANTVQRLLWVKDDSPWVVGLTQMPWITGDEEIYVCGRSLTQFGGKPRKGYYITHESRSAASKAVDHPTPKPVGLMESLIEKCPPGVVADPFAGSGATLIAARNLGRRAVGVELEERYCELIAKRLAQQAFDFGGIG